MDSYDIKLDISPKRKYLKADVKIKLQVKEDTEILKFYLYKNFNITSIICKEYLEEVKVLTGTEPPFTALLEPNEIQIRFNKIIKSNECIDIEFNYNGYMNEVVKYGANRISEEWIELGMYSPWFPYCNIINEAYFKVDLNIDSKYKVINSEEINNIKVIKQKNPFYDCNIIASDRFKTIFEKLDNVKLSIHYIQDNHKDIATFLAESSCEIFDFYNCFGKTNEEDISIVILPRNDAGGYSRKGLIVLDSQIDSQDRIEAVHYIAHEIAHFWWNKAKQVNSWEDWLNESFAEFSSLLVLRSIYGEDVFENKIDKYRNKASDLPALKYINRNNEKAFLILYVKGPLILNEIMNFIGEEVFLKFLNQIHLNNISTTDDLIKELIDIAGVDAGKKLERLLEQ